MSKKQDHRHHVTLPKPVIDLGKAAAYAEKMKQPFTLVPKDAVDAEGRLDITMVPLLGYHVYALGPFASRVKEYFAEHATRLASQDGETLVRKIYSLGVPIKPANSEPYTIGEYLAWIDTHSASRVAGILQGLPSLTAEDRQHIQAQYRDARSEIESGLTQLARTAATVGYHLPHFNDWKAQQENGR